MSSLIDKYKNQSTPDFLERSHADIKKRYTQKEIEKGVIENAKILQQFLRELKQYNKSTNIIENLQYRVVIEEMLQTNPKLCDNLFLGESGISLEQDLTKVIDTVAKTYTNVKSSSEQYDVGTKRFVFTEGYRLLENTAKEELRTFYQLAQNELYKYHNLADKKTKKRRGIVGIYGKIDTVGLHGQIELKANISLEAQQIISALKEATFTDKNYVSSNTLQLGMTNPFRVFVNMLGYSKDYTVSRWCRMLQCAGMFEEPPHGGRHEEGKNYFYGIRAIYELTGGGGKYRSRNAGDIKDLLNQIGYAKYLVLNRGGSKNGQIYVKSTAQIINNIYDARFNAQNWNQALYGTITIPASAIQNLTN